MYTAPDVGGLRRAAPHRQPRIRCAARRGREELSGYFWVVLGFLVVAVTKYLTSVRLRGLAERMHREQADATELRRELLQAEEREGALKMETERLQTKVSALRNVVGNLERSLQRHSRGGGDV